MKATLLIAIAILSTLTSISAKQPELILSPYLGYTQFKGQQPYKNTVEWGLSLRKTLTPHLGIESHFGYLPTQRTDQETRITTLYKFELGAILILNPNQERRFFLSSGISDIKGDSIFSPLTYLGTGLLFRISKDYITRIEIKTGIQSGKPNYYSLQFGFEKQIFKPSHTMTKKSKPTSTIILPAKVVQSYILTPKLKTAAMSVIESPKKVERSMPLVTVSLITTQKIYQLKPQQNKTIKDIQRHWSKKPVESITSYGIISPHYNKFFPKGNVTQYETEKMIIKALYVQHFLNQAKASIQFSINGIPGESYPFSLSITDSNNTLIKTIYNKKNMVSGTYQTSWDATNGNNKSIKEGTYQLHAKLFKKEKLIAKETSTIKVSKVSHPIFESKGPSPYFQNSPDPEWAQTLIKKSTDSKLLKSDKKTALKKINRVDFIVAIAKGLHILGAPINEANTPLNYSDKKKIPNYAINYVNTYTTELGQKNNKKKKLNPLRSISRAEAATILDRLINWQAPQTN